ncbi:ABC-type transport auxiliary lipoprotein family protein [soil metagenome]
MRAVFSLGLAALLLSACALGTPPPAPALFDLGPQPASGSTAVALNLTELSAPSWLAGTGIPYRLAYADAYRRELYRDSRWVAPPAALLGERLRRTAAAAGRSGEAKPVSLRLELEEFSQNFSAPGRAEVTVRLRAWRGDAQMRVFEVTRPTTSADAPGAVRALSEASDALIDQLLAWAAASTRAF